MALDFRVLTINFVSSSGFERRESATAVFPTNIRRAEAALRAFDIGYSNEDHHVWREKVDIDIVRIVGNTVEVAVNYLYRDSSGSIDDRFNGRVEVLVIADIV
jgi:hypothetical protein